MLRLMVRRATTLLIVLGVTAVPVPAAQAQVVVYPATRYYHGAGGYSSNPYSSFGPSMHGIADLTRAQGDYAKKMMEARSVAIDNRRKALEQWLWESENLPTWEDDRVKQQKAFLHHSMNASDSEVYAGDPLNRILADLKKNPNRTEFSPNLTKEVVDQINFTTGYHGTSLGPLQTGKVKRWPPLLDYKFRDQCHELDALIEQGIRAAHQTTQGDSEKIFELHKKVEELQAELKDLNRKDHSIHFGTWADARGFLDDLSSAIKVLEQPDARDFLRGVYRPKQARTVAELVRHMIDSGVEFGPVPRESPGARPAYKILYDRLREYQMAVGAPLDRDKRLK